MSCLRDAPKSKADPQVVWRRGGGAQQWRSAEDVWVPKKERSSTIKQFRIILLLSVNCKILFSIFVRRITELLLRNSYIPPPSVQKRGGPKAPRLY